VSATGSASGSATVAVAVRTSSVFGAPLESATVAEGALSATVTVGEESGAPAPPASEPVTVRPIESPRSPLPTPARSSVGPVSPSSAVPLRVHW